MKSDKKEARPTDKSNFDCALTHYQNANESEWLRNQVNTRLISIILLFLSSLFLAFSTILFFSKVSYADKEHDGDKAPFVYFEDDPAYYASQANFISLINNSIIHSEYNALQELLSGWSTESINLISDYSVIIYPTTTAVLLRDTIALEILLKAGFSPDGNCTATEHRTWCLMPINIAIMSYNYAALTMLVQHGADVNIVDKINGYTPLNNLFLCSKERKRYNELLFLSFTLGAFPLPVPLDHDNVSDEVISLYKHVAVKPLPSSTKLKTRLAMADFLVDHGASVYLISSNASPLDILLNECSDDPSNINKTVQVKLYDILEKHRINLAPLPYRNESLIHAIERNNYKVIDYMFKHGLNVNNKDAYGDTPIHIASWLCNAAAIKWLRKHGAVLSSRNNDNELPYDVAKNTKCDVKILKMLK